MTPEMNMTYESFIRSAFSIDKEHMVDRWGDPASLANTDEFGFGDIEEVKAAIAYSMAIFRSHIINNYDHSDSESNNMDRIIRDVINAPDKNRIFELINEFKNNYVDKFIKYKWQK